MSDTSQGPGWWIASDGKWYPPEQHPDYIATPQVPEYEVPSYEQPSYEPPSYEPPSYEQPTQSYQPPSSQPPSYEQPTQSYQPPSSQPPSYEQPAASTQPPAPSYQPPAPAYGSTPPPPMAPTPPKKRNWALIIVGVLLAGLLLIGGCVFAIWNLARGPIDAANEFLADVAAEDFTAAVNHLDAACFGAGDASPEALRAIFGDSVTSYDLTQTSNEGGNSGTASGTVTRDGFGTQPVTFSMTKPADQWLVCGFQVGS